MKKFLVQCSVFILLIVILLVFIELANRKIPNSYQFKNQWMEQNASDVQILILGSSHTYKGINPAVFRKKAFNLANVSQPFKYDLFFVKKFIDQMPELEYIILPASYFSFFENISKGREWWRETYYLLYMDADYYPCNPKYHFEISHLPSATSKFTSYYFRHDDMVNVDSLGFFLSNKKENKPAVWDNGYERAIQHTIKDFYYLSRNMEYLNQIAELAEERNVKVIMVSLPVRKSYMQAMDSNQVNRMYSSIEQLIQKHKNIYYFNLFQPTHFTDDDFFDGDHLTVTGAEKLTLLLQDSIDSIKN